MAAAIKQPPVSPHRGEGWRELFRYVPDLDDGNLMPERGRTTLHPALVPADGTPGIAFVGRSESGWPYAVYSNRARTTGIDAPVSRAMRLGAARYGACNGRRVNKAGEYV